MKNFADRTLEAVDGKQNPSIIGLDTDFTKIPAFIREEMKNKLGAGPEGAAAAMLEFNKVIIDMIHEIVPAVKIQSAFYEQYGFHGCKAFMETVKCAKSKGLIVVADVKRNDIGNTTVAYSNAYLGRVPLFDSLEPMYDLDSITVTPYLGSDGIKPFVDDCKSYGKGIFVVVKTSNPSSGEIQDLMAGGRLVYERVAEFVNSLGNDLIGERGYSSAGAAVGATYPRDAAHLRKIMPHAIFLVPGYGAQGGGAADVVPCFNPDGYGALIHSARSVIFAYQKTGNAEEFGEAARQATLKMREDIIKALKEKGICPW